MTGTDTGHVHVILGLIRIGEVSILGHGLIHPFGEITVDVDGSVLVLKAVTEFDGSDLLVLGLVVDGIGGADRHVYRLVFRCPADETGIEEDVMILSELVVHTGFDRSSDTYYGVTGGDVVVVITVGTPIMIETQRCVDEGREVILAVLEATEHTFLHDRSGVVTVSDVAYTQFLVHPCVIVAFGVILRQHTLTGSIHIVTAAEEVRYHGLVNTLVPAYIDTGGHLQAVKPFLVIGGNESYPVMIVPVLTDNEFRSVFGCSVDVLHHAVVEHSGGLITEGSGYNTVVCTTGEVTVTIS